MIKNDVRIKENITLEDKVNAIESIASSYFSGGSYTPYYSEMAKVIAIFTYFVKGIEFEEDERIYSSVMSDDELISLLTSFRASDDWQFVISNVYDKVEFMKQEKIHSHKNMDKIIEFCDVIIDSLENFSKLNLTQISQEDMENSLKVVRQLADKDFTAEDLSSVLKGAVGFNMDDATAEIIDSKNEKIRELEKYKTLWESRNAVATINPGL